MAAIRDAQVSRTGIDMVRPKRPSEGEAETRKIDEKLTGMSRRLQNGFDSGVQATSPLQALIQPPGRTGGPQRLGGLGPLREPVHQLSQARPGLWCAARIDGASEALFPELDLD